MPIYTKDVSTLAEVTQASPKSTKMRVSAGVVHRIYLFFPAGQQGLHHVQLFHGSHQFAPSTELQSFSGDDSEINFNEHYKLGPGPYTITIVTWNESTKYTHAAKISIGILPEWVLIPHKAFQTIADRLRRLLRLVGAR